MREEGELGDCAVALQVADGLLLPVRPRDGDAAHHLLAPVRRLVEGHTREPQVLSLPGELEVPHVHGILSPGEAPHGDVAGAAAFALAVVVLVVIVVEVFVSAVILSLNSRLIAHGEIQLHPLNLLILNLRICNLSHFLINKQ